VTIAISLKVNDGVVLAADSASTLVVRGLSADSSQGSVANVYVNANKVFNLLKGSPIGLITWGSGAIGNASISTLAKDLRRRFAGEDPQHRDWVLGTPGKNQNYTIEAVAHRVRQFMFEEQYQTVLSAWPENQRPALGFIVAGYSSGETMAEEYQVIIQNGSCEEPKEVRPKEASGVTWFGQGEAITRLMFGVSSLTSVVLQQSLGVPKEQLEPAVEVLKQALQAPLVMPPMPIQDAIDLAEFLVDLTIKFTRFMPGTKVVGGPIEIAAITKHEGFKWVKRKFYYSREQNPED